MPIQILFILHIFVCLITLISYPLYSAPLSPADRDFLLQNQQDLLKKNQLQRNELQRSFSPEVHTAPAPTMTNDPCFILHKISINNATLISDKLRVDFEKGYIDKCVGMSEISKLARDVSGWYIHKGYITSRAFITEQDLSQGELNISVLEGRLEK